MNVFVANLGNRDVWFNVGTSENPDFVTFKKWDRANEISEMLGCESGTRACISALAKEYPDRQELLRLLRFPILQPALEHAANHCTSREETLDRVILIATDQDRNENPGHYPWDTIEAAHLLRELLPLQAEFGSHFSSDAVDILPVESAPQRFETAYLQLGKLFDRLEETGVNAYASLKGGIPALNSALRLHVLNFFGPRAYLLETDEPSTDEKNNGVTGRPFFVDSWPYRRDALLRIARDLLDAHEYDALLDVLKRELTEAERKQFETLEFMLRHATMRFNLNFEGASEVISGEAFGTGHRSHWRHSARREPESLQRLYELAWTARILLERRDYGNFVVRVATLLETCRGQVVRLLLGFDPERTLGLDGLPGSMDTLEQSLTIKRDIERNGVFAVDQKGRQLRVNNPLRDAIIEWGSVSSDADDAASGVAGAHEHISELAALGEIRNEIIHEARGPSEREINDAFPDCQRRFFPTAEKLLGSMEQVYRSHGKDTQVTKHVYERLNEDILAELRTH